MKTDYTDEIRAAFDAAGPATPPDEKTQSTGPVRVKVQ